MSSLFLWGSSSTFWPGIPRHGDSSSSKDVTGALTPVAQLRFASQTALCARLAVGTVLQDSLPSRQEFKLLVSVWLKPMTDQEIHLVAQRLAPPKITDKNNLLSTCESAGCQLLFQTL